MREGTPGAGKCAQSGRQNTVKFEHRTLVKDHRVEIAGLDAGMSKTPLDGFHRESRIVFAARKPFFLNRCDRYPVNDKRGCRVMIMRRYAENLHFSTGFRARARAPAE